MYINSYSYNMYVCAYGILHCIYIYIYVHIYIYIYIYVYIHIYTHTYIWPGMP